MNTKAKVKNKEAANPSNKSGFSLKKYLKQIAPKNLFSRTLIILIAPMLILQTIITFVFIERQWQMVTERLSQAVINDISALLTIYEGDVTSKSELALIARDMDINTSFADHGELPAIDKDDLAFFSLLNDTLTTQLRQATNLPFTVDTPNDKNPVTIIIKLDNNELVSFEFRRNRAYASNSHIFLVWMLSSSIILIIISTLFLRNQVRPIQQLAKAAKVFGMGRTITQFKPKGAREVREAATAFIKMSNRISRQIEQRTTMLAGVSHDLRTILTRFRLQVAMLGDNSEIEELKKDINDMEQMLESYLNFARDESDEPARLTNLNAMIKRASDLALKRGRRVGISVRGNNQATIQRNAITRCIGNLINNAADHGQNITINAINNPNQLTITVEDDGPGIPPSERKKVFQPFYRLDRARTIHNQFSKGEVIATPFPDQDSSLLSVMAAADALIIRPAMSKAIENDPARIIILPGKIS